MSGALNLGSQPETQLNGRQDAEIHLFASCLTRMLSRTLRTTFSHRCRGGRLLRTEAVARHQGPRSSWSAADLRPHAAQRRASSGRRGSAVSSLPRSAATGSRARRFRRRAGLGRGLNSRRRGIATENREPGQWQRGRRDRRIGPIYGPGNGSRRSGIILSPAC